MPIIPIDSVEAAVTDLLTKIRAGVGAYAHARGEGVRMGKATLTLEVTFAGDEVTRERQESSQELGTKTTTTTEEPIGTDANNHGEITTSVKTGSYTQTGSQGTAQGGGSQEVQNYEYDQA